MSARISKKSVADPEESKLRTETFESFMRQTYAFEERVASKKQKAKEKQDARIKKECSFKPAINENSRAIAREHKAFQIEGMEFYKDRRDGELARHEADAYGNCSFKPNILTKKQRFKPEAFSVGTALNSVNNSIQFSNTLRGTGPLNQDFAEFMGAEP